MMRRITLAVCLTLTVLSTPSASADSCKPDLTSQDRITKKQVDQWQQVLSSSGFLSAALMDNDVTVTAFVQRGGDQNFVIVSIQKLEENTARAAFESHYHGAKGDQLVFGFKNGDPLSFVVTEVSNQAKVEGLITPKLNMSVVWAAEVPDADMAKMRDALTTKQVDAIRVIQAGGQFDQPVAEKNGKRLMEKFGCFYQALDKRGIDLNSPAKVASGDMSRPDGQTPPSAESVQGKYIRKGKSSDFLDLSHGMCTLLQDGHNADCTYEISGDSLILAIPRMRAHAKARIVGNTIVDNEGIVWEKQADASASAPPSTSSESPEARLQKLNDLYKKGLITKEEFDAKRAEILKSM